MAKELAQTNGRRFRFYLDETLDIRNIPQEVLQHAFDDTQSVFGASRIQEAGQLPLKGGSVLTKGATVNIKELHPDFRRILKKRDGMLCMPTAVAQV